MLILITAEEFKAHTNTAELTKTLESIEEDFKTYKEREGIMVKMILPYKDGVVSIGDAHLPEVVSALQKKAVTANFYGMYQGDMNHTAHLIKLNVKGLGGKDAHPALTWRWEEAEQLEKKQVR